MCLAKDYKYDITCTIRVLASLSSDVRRSVSVGTQAQHGWTPQWQEFHPLLASLLLEGIGDYHDVPKESSVMRRNELFIIKFVIDEKIHTKNTDPPPDPEGTGFLNIFFFIIRIPWNDKIEQLLIINKELNNNYS